MGVRWDRMGREADEDVEGVEDVEVAVIPDWLIGMLWYGPKRDCGRSDADAEPNEPVVIRSGDKAGDDLLLFDSAEIVEAASDVARGAKPVVECANA